MKRVVEAELLDELAPGDARAIRSRRDLRRVNFWMGNYAIAAGALKANFPGAPQKMADVGAGDGNFLLGVLQRTGWRDTAVVMVDRRDAVSKETLASFREMGASAKVVTADAQTWLPDGECGEIVLCNLFLHHFNDGQLAQLLQKISNRARLFVAVEPRRLAFPFFYGQLLRLIGCNGVTRHDAVKSIRAGFLGREISSRWPDGLEWRLAEQRAGLFSHLFVAKRIS